MTEIRREREEDHAAIDRLLEEAFGSPAEAELVRGLREAGELKGALVALERSGEVEELVGYIASSEVSCGAILGIGLAPMAVRPDRWSRGIGSELVRAWLALEELAPYPFAVVLGHPAYYPRFGFERADRFGLESQWLVPPEAFLVMELIQGGLEGAKGVVRFHPLFDQLG